MDCSGCGAPLASQDLDWRFCGRGRAARAPVPAATGSGLWIVDVGKKKIGVISALREHLEIDLREAKALADSTSPIRISLESSRVARAIEDLRSAGADARLLLL